MQLVEIIEQHRRDFKGRYVCEFCGEEYVDNGLLTVSVNFKQN